MTIRRTLLVAFLLVSLTPSVILTYLAFVKTRGVLELEIETSLEAQAATVSADVDHMLFERLQNVLSWNRLEVMQDIRIKDVDKRLSQFLAEVKAAYGGVYEDLYCIDTTGRIVAASDPSEIGTQASLGTPWLRAELPNGSVILDMPRAGSGSGHVVLPIHAAITSAVDGSRLGDIVLLFDWQQIEQILDNVAQSGHWAVVLDPAGRTVAASAGLRRQGLSMQKSLAGWLPATGIGSGVEIRSGTPASAPQVIVGFDRSRGFEHFAGFGWTTLVVQSTADALLPVHRMGLVFVGLLAATLLLTSALSMYVAGRIARPIARLTAFTRRFARENKLPEPPAPARGEVGELTETFVTTVRDLDRSRQDFVRASKLAVAGEVAATMAHEIRTPLGILRSSAQVLRQESGISAEGRELVGFIESETERINRLVTSLLESAKPRLPAFARRNIGNIVHSSIAMLMPQAEALGLRIDEISSSDNLEADCDAEQMTQTVLNLLLNAMQMLTPGGCITVECVAENGSIRIDVGDSGPGIADADRARVFEPFFSRRSGGLGLGLAVVREVISAHSGSIAVGRSPLGGALFTLRIPRNANE